RVRASTVLMGPERYPPAAFAANDQALQQRRSFSWRTPATVRSDCLGAFPQAPQVLFMFLPTDIGGMRFGDERVPFLPRQLLNSALTIDIFANPAATIDED